MMTAKRSGEERLNWFQGIQAKFILKFLPIILLIPVLLAVVTYYGEKQSVIKFAKEYLTSVVTLKARAIEEYFSSGLESLKILSDSTALKELSKFNVPTKQPVRMRNQILASVRGALKNALRTNIGFDEFFVLDPQEGYLLASTERENEGKIYRSEAFFKEGLKGPYTDKMRLRPDSDKPVVYSSVVVTDYAGSPIGVLVGRHELKSIIDLVEKISVLGKTGDSYLFNENQILMTKPRNFKTIPYGGVFTEGVKRAFLLGKGSGIYKGMRRDTMIGSFQSLRRLGLGLIAEEALAEALRPLYDLKKNLAVAAILVTLFSLLALWVISKQIVKPLSALSKAVSKFSDGNFAARADLHTHDEIGRLAQNFNHMASSLEKLYGNLEEQVKKRTEELVNSLLETEEARSEWEDTFHAMSDALFIYDEKGTIRRLNKSAEEMIGKKEMEVRGFALNEALTTLPPKDKEGHFANSWEAEGAQTQQQYRISHFSKQDAKGITRGGVLVYRNITEEKMREQEYKEVQVQLLEASKLAAIGTLAAGVAHEFNNVIAGIRLHADLALSMKSADKMERALKVAVESCTRAARIISSLLVFSRRKSTEKTLEKFQEVVVETLGLIEADFNARGITVEKQFSELPMIEMDRSQISQVILNLLTNARDAVIDRKDPKIKISLHREEPDAVLAISDNGQGIAQENLSKIFEPFFTTKGILAGGTHTAPGTGLGLSISYGIIQTHGGHIEARSVSGQGATFIVKLPLETKAEIVEIKDVSPRPAKRCEIQKKEVLVVDDEENIRNALKDALENMGQKVWLAKDGAEGLEMARRIRPNVLFIDLIMPGLSGVNLIEQLNHQGKKAKIVAMSGAMLENMSQLEKLGIDAILQKPFKVSDLEETFYKVVKL